MAINQTFEKQIDENGNEIMVLISEEFVPDPEPIIPTLEELQQTANDLIAQLQQTMADINAGNYMING